MEMAMTDLREKIVDELRFARSLDDSRTDDEVADHIIALLPKVPEDGCQSAETVLPTVDNWPSPTESMLDDPVFSAIWQCIKGWDISVPNAYEGYMGATGNHVCAILEGIQPLMPKVPELRWDGPDLLLGNLLVGDAWSPGGVSYRGKAGEDVVAWNVATEQEARTAVERAVREALGWEA